MRKYTVRDFMEITKALGDGHRVRALMLLKEHELCVCQIIEILGLAPSTVSRHMALLKQARLVEARKSGRWIYYRRAESENDPHVRETFAWLDHALETDADVSADQKQLEVIVKIDPELLCKKSDC